jgi:hypothetical protein
LECQKPAPLGLLGGIPNAGQTVLAMHLDRCPEGVIGLPRREGGRADGGNVHRPRRAGPPLQNWRALKPQFPLPTGIEPFYRRFALRRGPGRTGRCGSSLCPPGLG